MAFLEKTRSRSRLKKVKPLKRSRKPIARKAKFHAQDNPLKSYKTKAGGEVQRYANLCRQNRLSNPTTAELAFAAILDSTGVKYEREHIEYYSGRFSLFDFYIKEKSVAFELDGGIHKTQARYDDRRDHYFLSKGIRTIRFQNAEVTKTPQAVEAKVVEILNGN